jgi:hypothetical protein
MTLPTGVLRATRYLHCRRILGYADLGTGGAAAFGWLGSRQPCRLFWTSPFYCSSAAKCLHRRSVWCHSVIRIGGFLDERILVSLRGVQSLSNIALVLTSHWHGSFRSFRLWLAICMTRSTGFLRATRCLHCRPFWRLVDYGNLRLS